MSEYEIKNARITDTTLGKEDHGILTFWLGLEYDGGGQGCGGYALSCTPRGEKRQYANVGGLIENIMRIAGVEKWEDLKGRYIQVKSTHCAVPAIRPILSDDDDDWFSFEEFFKEEWQPAKV